MTLKRSAHKLWRFLHAHRAALLVYGASLLVFLIGARYVDYPDEYVNLLGGRTMLHGGLPYRDFWDHHLPGAWIGAAVLLLFSGGSFVIFRLLWALFVWGLFTAIGEKAFAKDHPLRPYYLAFMFVYPFAALYFWFHLFLADSIAVVFFSSAFWLLTSQWVKTKRSDLILILSGLSVFAMVFASATYMYLAVGMYAMLAYVWGLQPARLARLVAFMLVPYILFGLYLLVSGTWSDFYFANMVYNSVYYISIPNFSRGTHFNPIKFAMTLASNFYAGYLPLLSKIKHLDLYLPIGTLAGLSTVVLAVLLLATEPLMGLGYLIVLSFSAPRSNVQNYKETDYQMSMFIVLGLVSTMLLLYLLRRIKYEQVVGDVLRVARAIVFVFLSATILFLGVNAYEKAFKMYTQVLPSIHNRGFTAEFFDEVLRPGETYFVGPYEPQDLFFERVTSYSGRHPSLLPQFREGAELRQSFLEDIQKTNPTLVVYKHEASVFNTPAVEFGKFFLDWMAPRYRSIEQIEGVEVLKTPSSFTMRSDLYIRRDKQEEVLKRLEEHGYIKRS